MRGRKIRPGRVFMTADAVGGVWTHVLELSRGLGSKGIETVVAVLGPRATAEQVREAKSNPLLTLVATDLPLDWLARSEREVDDAARCLMGLAIRSEADISHLHAPALAGGKRWPMPLVVTAHSCVGTWWSAVRGGPVPRELAWRVQLTRIGLGTADAVLAPSRCFAASLAETYGGIAVEAVHNGRSPPLRSRDVPHSERSGVIAAGRLWDAGKDMATLDAAAQLAGFEVRAAGAARGPGEECFEPRRIALLGELDHRTLEQHFRSAAVFASPAVYEPFGLAALEAAQQGAVLVLSDIATFRELWDGAALFFPPRRADRLARCIGRALGDVQLRRQLGELARGRARRFTLARMTAATLAVYAGAMQARRAGDAGRPGSPRRPAHAA